MPTNFGNIIRFNAAAYGTGDFVVASAAPGCAVPENSNVTDGKTYGYYAKSADGIQWERGSGTYVVSNHTLQRTNIVSSSDDLDVPVVVNFSAAPVVDVFPSPNPNLELALPIVPTYPFLILTEAHAANAATFALTPSDGLPFIVRFSDGSNVSVPGGGISVTITSGATLAALAATPFRVWFAIFNNGGAAVLGARTCTKRVAGYPPTFSIIPPSESVAASTTAMSAASDLAHVFYTPSALSPVYWKWIGYADYDSGLATPGTWTVSPTNIVFVDNDTPRPGTVLQSIVNGVSSTGAISLANTRSATSYTVSITPTSKCNMVETGIDGGEIFLQAVGGMIGDVYITYDAFATFTTGTAFQRGYSSFAGDVLFPYSLRGYDFPGVNTLVTFTWWVGNTSAVVGTISFRATTFWTKEIMT